jgi:hypothetical protein
MSRVAFILAVVVAGCGVSIGGAPSDHTSGDPGQPGATLDASEGSSPGSDDPIGPGSGDTGSDSGSGTTGNTLDAQTFLHDIGEHLCNEAFKCAGEFPGSGGDFSDLWGASKNACYAILDAYYQVDGVADEVTSGNIAYDPGAALDCIASITYGSCSNFWQNGAGFGASCAQALVGSADAGEACVVDFDCSGQLLCHQGVCQ